MSAGETADATELLIHPAEASDQGSEGEYEHRSAISIASSGYIFSKLVLNRSQVLRNLAAEANGDEFEASAHGQHVCASTSLPIHPASFALWLRFDCNACIGDVAPETLRDLAQVRELEMFFHSLQGTAGQGHLQSSPRLFRGMLLFKFIQRVR